MHVQSTYTESHVDSIFYFCKSEVLELHLKVFFLLRNQLLRLASVKNITKYYAEVKLKIQKWLF